MEILLFFLVATVCVVGWAAGSFFVCTFLTLITLAVLGILSGMGVEGMPIFVCLVTLVGIWVPRWYLTRH